MTGSVEALWQRHEELRGSVAGLSERLAVQESRHDAVVEKLDESRQERARQFETVLRELKETRDAVSAVRDEVATARGAAKFGKWVAGILVALGVPGAVIAWYTHR